MQKKYSIIYRNSIIVLEEGKMERRVYKRYPIKVLKTLKYKLEDEIFNLEGFIENISLGGCNFITVNPIPDDVSEVFFDIRYHNEIVPLKLEIVRRRKSEFFKKKCNEYGLKFQQTFEADMFKHMKFV